MLLASYLYRQPSIYSPAQEAAEPARHDPEAVREIMRSNTHLAAAKRFLTEDFGAAGTTGVWPAHHLNPARTRCPSCAQLTDRAQSGDLCGCGQPLPQMPEYW